MSDANPNGRHDAAVTDPPAELMQLVQADVDALGGLPVEPLPADAIGVTMFDLPGSEDHTVTVLLPQKFVQRAPSQALVRIASKDGRNYLGIVTAGPFAEPDGLRADAHLLVTVHTQGGVYLPPYHGRVQVAILGEELPGGAVQPPRLRPLPNSHVFVLDPAQAAGVLKTDGDLRLGTVVGYADVTVNIPSRRKDVLPRHTAVLGTTGGGKSTTVARLTQQAQAAGMAVVLLDVEGEYTHLHEPADQPALCEILARAGLAPAGLPAEHMTLYHLVGRDTANPDHPRARPFSLQFARMSPYTAMEILGLTEPQQERFLKAFDVTREVMRDLGIFPTPKNADEERIALELDEFERGYPRMTLSLLIDVASACQARAERTATDKKTKNAEEEPEEVTLYNKMLNTEDGRRSLNRRLHTMNVPGNAISWRALLGRLWRLQRLKVLYDEKNGVRPLSYAELLKPGQVSVVDLSDSGASELNNLVIADLLHGVQETQDGLYQRYEQAVARGEQAAAPPRVLLIIEEAHEFLATERIDKMRTLFQQVARIAKRGRKRWLSLMFVTQLPQHLPKELFGLVNSYVLHKITDPQVVSTLQKTVSGIDTGLWSRLSGLAPGQAIVACPHLARPLLAAIDPAPCKLRLTD